jgi:hypothetical protein
MHLSSAKLLAIRPPCPQPASIPVLWATPPLSAPSFICLGTLAASIGKKMVLSSTPGVLWCVLDCLDPTIMQEFFVIVEARPLMG